MINQKHKKDYLKEHIEFLTKYNKEVGSKIFELEEEFKKYFQIKYASACSSGSTALILALKSIGIKEGDEIMLNCNYFISDPNSILICGGKPVFIDLGETINSLSINEIKKNITQKTKAIIIIHMYGYPIKNTIEIIDFCKKNNIYVIEDSCQAIGAKIGEKYAGTIGDIGIFSFDSNKLVKGGEGGMIISNNEEIIEKTRLFKNNCKKGDSFIDIGFNFRYNDFSAIYARYSLFNLKNIINEKKEEIKNLNEEIYYGGDNIFPNFYNLIIKKNNESIIKDIIYTDFLKINPRNFPNYIKNIKTYEIRN